MTRIHSLLKRQLKRYLDDPDSVPPEWQNFIGAVNDAYWQSDADRRMLERSLDLSSQELLQANSELRTIFQAFPDLLYRLDNQGTILDCKAGYTNDLYIPLGKLIGKKIHDVPLDIVGFKLFEAIHQVQENRSMVTIEYPMQIKGQNNFYEARLLPILEDQIIVIVRNITNLKQAEEELILLATAIEQFSESVIIVDRKEKIQYANPAFEALSGFTRKELTGKNYSIFMDDNHDENFYKKIWDIISIGKMWSGRITNRMKDGTSREFETRISPVRDSAGKIVNFVSVIRDITHEIKLESQLQQAHKMESIGTLAGGIAHDFNNILSSVFGFTELALNETKIGSSQYEHLQEILVAGNRAKDLVKQILTFSRQIDLEQKPIQVKPILKEALRLLRASIPSTVNIKENVQSNSLVIGDPTQIHQVLMNLCLNAAHSMENDGGVLTVRLSDVELNSEFVSNHPDLKPGPYIELTVTDTGHGIPPDVIEKIFDPFFTTKEKGEGTGMGLSVVHGIVRSHRGDIHVYSEPEKGSTFKVFFPKIERRLKPAEKVDRPIPTGTERILFIDDELALVEANKQILNSLGYDVVTRTSSIEALQLFEEKKDHFNLVITDMTMPHMTGIKLAENLLQIRPDIPVILCTGFSSMIDEQEALDMNIRAFISKPILKQEIAETIRKVLDE